MIAKQILDVDLQQDVRLWDRTRWSLMLASNSVSVRKVVGSLGLTLASGNDRGPLMFKSQYHLKLSNNVAELTMEIPKTKAALYEYATNESCLGQEIEDLLVRHGPIIWGKDADRSCLLIPDPTAKVYSEDLFYEDPRHQHM